MSIRSVALLVCLALFTIASHDPSYGHSNDPSFALIGLAGLGLVTLRSEGRRRSPAKG